MSPAVLEAPPKPQLWIEELTAPPPLSFREVGCAYPSGRSFGFSVVLHQLVLLLVLFFPGRAFMRSVEAIPPKLETAIPVDGAIYLPSVGGGSEGEGKIGGGSGADQDLSSGLRARSRKGFAYPGPQPMVSDPPRSTLGIQTILQPALKDPPLVHRYVPLPNIAQPAEVAVAEPPKPVMKVLGGEVALRPVPAPVAPKITLPMAAASQVPALDASQPIVPRLLPAKPPVPGPAEISNPPMDRRLQKGLLVINAVPAAPDVPTSIPLAEARSLFAVAPGEATVIADPGAGSKAGDRPSMAAGTGTPGDVPTGDAVADAPAGGHSANAGGSGSGNGGHYGSANGSGVNAAGAGSGTGRGTAAGAGTGSGPGTAIGSGKGAGSAPGGGGFPGIAISGGRYGNSGSGSMHASIGPHHQTSYAMTITSTASSGGGLSDFGVFYDEKVYTVYLDMRASDEDPAPSWTLQYAVLQPGDPAGRIRGTPTPPYATLKQVPELSADLAAKCAHQLIVASAILNATGKLEQVSMKQTPDSRVSALITEALGNWTFEPAQIDGKPVALKILLGIRLSGR